VSARKKILLDTHFRHIEDIFSAEDKEKLYGLGDIVWGKNEPIPMDEYDKVRSDVFAIVTGGWRYGEISDCENLRVIMDVGGRHPGPEDLDYATCFARSIRVLTCSPAFGPMVAEMALGMALAASREIVFGDRLFRAGEEIYLRHGNKNTFTLFKRKIGFIGFGALARNLLELLLPFRCSIQVYDPWLPKAYLRDQDVEPVDMETLLSTSKVIFVLAIPTKQNRHLLSRENLQLVPRDSVLVLISRAHLVDFEALTEFVLEGRFRAAIDVFPEEPMPKDHPIRKAEHAVLSAHRAGSVLGDLKLIGKMVTNDLEALVGGLPPREMLIAEPEYIENLTLRW
jgi:phosphoglycerate dehydrogenase-like enzyme